MRMPWYKLWDGKINISRIDFTELFDMFEEFSETEMIGIGADLTPTYFEVTEQYRLKFFSFSILFQNSFPGRNIPTQLWVLPEEIRSIRKKNYHAQVKAPVPIKRYRLQV